MYLLLIRLQSTQQQITDVKNNIKETNIQARDLI